MRVTVLGKSPAYTDAGGACSGYLIEEADTTLVLDMGNGVFGKLRHYGDYPAVDAVVVSHMHADHFIDLVPFAYALIHAPRQQAVPVDEWPGTDRPARPRLVVPPGGRDVLRRIVGAWGPEDLIERAFAAEEYDPAAVVEVGALRLRFQAVPHYVATNAVEVSSVAGGARLTYGADHRPADELVEFARGTDLLLIEATLPSPERGGARGHLTPGEAGDHGRRAQAARLVLTHLSDELDEGRARAEAQETFGKPVVVAREGDVYVV